MRTRCAICQKLDRKIKRRLKPKGDVYFCGNCLKNRPNEVEKLKSIPQKELSEEAKEKLEEYKAGIFYCQKCKKVKDEEGIEISVLPEGFEPSEVESCLDCSQPSGDPTLESTCKNCDMPYYSVDLIDSLCPACTKNRESWKALKNESEKVIQDKIQEKVETAISRETGKFYVELDKETFEVFKNIELLTGIDSEELLKKVSKVFVALLDFTAPKRA